MAITINGIKVAGKGVGLITGGATGQVLAKHSDDNFDVEWVNVTAEQVGADPVGSAADALIEAKSYAEQMRDEANGYTDAVREEVGKLTADMANKAENSDVQELNVILNGDGTENNVGLVKKVDGISQELTNKADVTIVTSLSETLNGTGSDDTGLVGQVDDLSSDFINHSVATPSTNDDIHGILATIDAHDASGAAHEDIRQALESKALATDVDAIDIALYGDGTDENQGLTGQVEDLRLSYTAHAGYTPTETNDIHGILASIETHNASGDAHEDIRGAINDRALVTDVEAINKVLNGYIDTEGTAIVGLVAEVEAIDTDFGNHTIDYENPHKVTIELIGAEPVGEAERVVGIHNSATDCHTDIRDLVGTAQSTADGVRTDYDIHAANKNNPHEVTPIQIGAVPQEWIYTNPDDANVQTAIRTSAEYGYIQLNHTTDGGTTNDGTWISCGSLGFNKGSSYRYLCLDDDANFAVVGEWVEDPSGSGNWVCDYYKILHEGNLSDLAGLDIGVSDSTIALLNNETTMGSSILDINDSTVIFRGSVDTDAEGNTTRTTGVSFDAVDISIFESDMVVDSAYAAINNTYFDIGDSSLNMVGNDIAIGNGAINIVECAVTIDNKPVLTSGFSAGTEAPSNTNLLWIDTGNSNVMKFYNGSTWVAVGAVWSA